MSRRQTKNLTLPLRPQIRPNNPIDPRTQRFTVLSDERAGIVVEAHHHPVFPLHFLCGADYDRVPDVPALDFVGGGDGVGGAGGEGGGVRASFLDDDDYAITWSLSVRRGYRDGHGLLK